MDPSHQNRRAAVAQQRIATAAQALAKRHGLDDQAAAVANARHRDGGIDALFKSEAIADLLDALVALPEPKQESQPEPKAKPDPKPKKE